MDMPLLDPGKLDLRLSETSIHLCQWECLKLSMQNAKGLQSYYMVFPNSGYFFGCP